MFTAQMQGLREEILPLLEQQGIVVATYDSLSRAERERADDYFAQHVFPVLTPLAVDPAHPFPYISGLSLNFGITVKAAGSADERGSFVRLKVPPVLPGSIQLFDELKFIPLSDVIEANLGSLFP